jgi:hypothetical protein
MSKLILTDEVIANAKQMIVNLEVAKTMDRKTNTRRLIKNILPTDCLELKQKDGQTYLKVTYQNGVYREEKPQYKVGEVYWIREPVQVTRCDDILRQYDYKFVADGKNVYQANIPPKYIAGQNRIISANWIKNLHRVPNGCIKQMARTFVKITNVRVERLQDITNQDLIFEGYHFEDEQDVKVWWEELWNSTAPKGYKWEDNPYVFVYEFERIET